MAIKRYAGDKFTGLSSDTKPTDVLNGANFFELDNKRIYIKESGVWSEVDYTNEAPSDGEQYVRQDGNWVIVDIPEGYDSTDFDTDFSSKSTSDLSEGINLYFTDSRAISAIQNDPSWNATDWDTAFSWGDHDAVGYLTSIPTSYVQEDDNISRLVNNVGYITDYTVTESDVTQHQSALSITESQISDFGTYDNYVSWNLKTDGVQRTTIGSGADLDIVGGTNVSTSYSAGGVVTLSSIDTTYTAGTGLTLSGTQFLLSDEVYTSAEKTKLDGIESGAEVNVGTDLDVNHNELEVEILSSTGSDTFILEADSVMNTAGLFLGTEKAKLAGIESGAEVNVGDEFNSSGTYSGLRAQSTTADDVGLGNVRNEDIRDFGLVDDTWGHFGDSSSIVSQDPNNINPGFYISNSGSSREIHMFNKHTEQTGDNLYAMGLTLLESEFASDGLLLLDIYKDGSWDSAQIITENTPSYNNSNWDTAYDRSPTAVSLSGGGNTSITATITRQGANISSSALNLTHTHATLSAGTGLSGTSYNGSTNRTWSADFGTASGTVAQGNDDRFVTGVSGSGNGTLTINRVGSNVTTSLAHTHSSDDIRQGIGFERDDGDILSPQSYDRTAHFRFTRSADLSPTPAGGSSWNSTITIYPWTTYNNSYPAHQIAFNRDVVSMRKASGSTSWDTWREFVFDGGTYSGLRAQATTKGDVGLSGIPNTNGSTSNYLRGDGSWVEPWWVGANFDGVWTPTDGSGAELTITVNTTGYMNMGDYVIVGADITYPSTGSSSTAVISGLPFTHNSIFHWMGNIIAVGQSSPKVVQLSALNDSLVFRETNGSLTTNSNLSGKRLRLSIAYKKS